MPRYMYPPTPIRKRRGSDCPPRFSVGFSETGLWHTRGAYGAQMAVVSKYGVWDNATYPWTDQTSAGAMGSIVTEIDAWISAISTNASIVANGQLPVKVRDPNSSTNSGVKNGFGYEFPDTTIGQNAYGPTWPTIVMSGTATTVVVEMGDQFVDSTANNGYGDFSSNIGHASLVTRAGDNGYSIQAIVAYDTTDGQEFIAVGIKMGSGTLDEMSFSVFKDTSGHWCFSAVEEAFCYDIFLNYWTGEVGPYDTDPTMRVSDVWKPLSLSVASVVGAVAVPGYDSGVQASWYPANAAIYSRSSSTSPFGSYADATTGKQILSLSRNGLAVLIDV